MEARRNTVVTPEQPKKSSAPLSALLEPQYARAFMKDIRAFGALNPGELDPILIARHFAAASVEVESGDFKNEGASYLQLAQALVKNAQFSAYHEKQTAIRTRELRDQKSQLSAAHAELLQAAKERIAADPFAPEATDLIDVVSKHKRFETENSDLDTLRSQLATFEQSLKTLGVGREQPANVAAASATVLDLKALSDLGANDTALLVNVGGDGPHAYRDLAGKVAFEKKRAVVCAPARTTLERQHRAFVEDKLATAWPGHTFEFTAACSEGYEGIDALLATGANLADGAKLPSPDKTAKRLQTKTLERSLVVKARALKKELLKREILSDQYRGDILEDIRPGYGGVSFQGDAEVGCIADVDDLRGHGKALAEISQAHWFDSAVQVETQVQLRAKDAFIRAQRGQCAYIYGAAPVIKQVIEAADRASLIATVLPVWITEAEIADSKATEVAQAEAQSAAEGERKAALQRARSEAEAAALTLAMQRETRQREYRARHGAKVASLVAALNIELEEARHAIDNALLDRTGVSSAAAEHHFWASFPSWYGDLRAKGWVHENSIATPRDYGLARWKGREVEAVVGNIKVMMKNANIGEYSEHCWSVGVVNDTEFSRYREPLVIECGDTEAFARWKTEHQFETRWDLGIGN